MRVLQPILIDAVLAKELGILMRHLDRTEAVVDRGAIESIEARRRVTIPPQVLAYMAASGESLHELVALDEALEAFFKANGDPMWKSRTKFAHVSFTAWGDWPRFHGVFDAHGTVQVFWLKAPQLEASSLSDVLRRRWPEIDFDAESDALCQPMIGAPAPPPVRIVTHPTFGKGTVLSELEGKLRIDFGEAGIKTLLAKFVTETPT